MEEKKSRRGPKKKADEELRKHLVACRLTDAEAEHVDQLRGGMTRGEWVRTAALKRPPRVIPEINREAWVALSRSASNFNQALLLARRTETQDSLIALKDQLAEFRAALIGADLNPDEEDEDESQS